MRNLFFYCFALLTGILVGAGACSKGPGHDILPGDPNPAFTVALDDSCVAPCVVTFTNESTNSESYYWDFGDGKSSTEANPSHTYQYPGVYTATLVASYSIFSAEATKTMVIRGATFDAPLGSGIPAVGLAIQEKTDLAYGGFVAGRKSLGYLVAGYSNSGGSTGQDVYLAFWDVSGKKAWEKTIPETGDAAGRAIAMLGGDECLIAGDAHAAGETKRSAQLSLVNTETGAVRWTRTFGSTHGQAANGVALTAGTQNYVMTGYRVDAAGEKDLWVACVNSFGEKLWEKTIGGPGNQEGNAISRAGLGYDNDDALLITGYTEIPGRGKDLYVVKINDQGDVLWEKSFGGAQDDIGYSTCRFYTVAGKTESFGASGSDMYLLYLDAAGNLLATYTYGGPADEEARWASFDTNLQPPVLPELLITGFTSSKGAGGKDIYVVKPANSAVPAFEKTWGGPQSEIGVSACITVDGGLLIAGVRNSEPGQTPAGYLIRTDENGNQ